MQLQVLESLAAIFTEGSGRGLCKRIIAVVKAANVLGLSFLEAFNKQPIEVLQLLSLKAQDSLVEASLLVQTHSMPAASIAQILAESFLKVRISFFHVQLSPCRHAECQTYIFFLLFFSFLVFFFRIQDGKI